MYCHLPGHPAIHCPSIAGGGLNYPPQLHRGALGRGKGGGKGGSTGGGKGVGGGQGVGGVGGGKARGMGGGRGGSFTGKGEGDTRRQHVMQRAYAAADQAYSNVHVGTWGGKGGTPRRAGR